MGIATDSSGRAYITGITTSDTSIAPFPTTGSAYQSSLSSPNGNAFLTVIDTNLSAAASLVYSTYLGGDGAGAFGDFGVGVTADTSGDAYLVGQATSDASGPFPTTPNTFQSTLNSPNGNAFLTEIATTQSGLQSLVYSTYFGGSTTNSLGDYGSAIALDSAGKVYMAGDAESPDFPITSGAFQATNSADGKAFVAKFDLSQSGAQSLVYSTFLGGTNSSSGDDASGLAVDASGNTFVVGQTSSTDFPTTSDAFQSTLKSSGMNAFLAEISPDGTAALYSTYLGGSSAFGDAALGVALDPLGNAYVTGYTQSSDFPTTAGAFQTTATLNPDSGFVAKLTLPTSLVSIAVSPQTASLATNTTQQFSAIGTLSDGSTADFTAHATWSSSNASVVSASSLAPTQGFAVAISAGTANITATVGSISGSAAVTITAAVTPIAPSITSVTPTSGIGGTQVTIAGSGFGATQGTGYVTLGTAFGHVVSWSDAQIVATVAAGSQTGVAQVAQAGLQSNSINFTVNGPTISSVSPTSGVAGTSVTITGTGFGATQGSGQVWLGSMSGNVTSWNDTQIVATVASGATSGTAQVLQNGVWSNSVSFAVNLPQITSVSPTSGAPGTVITVTGTGFGATQGSGQVWLGSTGGLVDTWSDTQVTATVASNALTGVARIQQGGTWSNAFSFTVPPSGGSSLTLSPNTITMVVGDTHSIEAINAQGQSVTGLTWTSTDTTVVTLSTDDPPILTAVAAGHVTITAGSASADVTVSASSLSPGTVQWTNPGDGSGVTSVVPAVPSPSGVDLFAFENSGNVAAITTDGTTAWNANLNGGFGIPSFDGGLVVVAGNQLQELNGTTGQPYSAYTFAHSSPTRSSVAVSTDGTVYAVDGDKLVAIDPATGSVKFSASMEDSSSNDPSICEGGGPGYVVGPPTAYQLTIAGDGDAYLVYSYSNGSQDSQVIGNCNYGFGHQDNHLRVLRVAPDGSSAKFDLGDWKEDSATDITNGPGVNNDCCDGYLTTSQAGSVPTLEVGSIITNADQGVVVSWQAQYSSYCAYTFGLFGYPDVAPQPSINAGCVADNTVNYLSTISGSGVNTSTLPFAALPVLQRDDGTFVGYSGDNGDMAAFDLSGNVEWSASNYSPQMVTAGGGVIAQSADGTTTATFDANGNATGQFPSLPSYSWKAAYRIAADQTVESVASPIPSLDSTYAAVEGGNLTGSSTSVIHHEIGLAWCGNGYSETGLCTQSPYDINGTSVSFSYIANPGASNINTAQDFSAAHPDWVGTIQANAMKALKTAFANFPVIVETVSSHRTGLSGQEPDQDHIVYVVGDWPNQGQTGENINLGASFVYYWPIMESAQTAAGYAKGQGPDCGENWCDLTPIYPPQTQADTAAFQKLVSVLGTGIGNTAAHEIGHQFIQSNDQVLLPYMDCGLGNNIPNPFACENNDNFVYNFFSGSGFPQNPSDPSSTGAQFKYVQIPGVPLIHWGPSEVCALKRDFLDNPNVNCN